MATERKMKAMDGNNAAAHVAYAFTDVAGIFPITPSSVMAELTDSWSAAGQKNLFGQEVKVIEMQSEGGAAGVVHGSLAAGALTTTFTASQGLLLMIPNMYKIAGELLPGVIHCSARALAGHALSIFGDHSDVMACRQTGFAMLAETNPQEVMDLSAVAHLAAIKGKVPFLNFFDGFRTSHEIQKVATWDYEQLKNMLDMDAVNAFRSNSLNPDHPKLMGTAQNPDIFFQAKEASNPYYDALPAIVEDYMDKVNAEIGTDYKLFNYYGHPEAERVIVAMGSACDMIEETIDYLMAKGEKVGLIKVRLYRPFVSAKFAAVIPATCKRISVLDRCKEPGSIGEPLFLDVVAALSECDVDIPVYGGRYGLGSKDTTPACAIAVYENLKNEKPVKNFTVGINDDVTGKSLPLKACPDIVPEGTVACKFWGLGGDGTVGANKNSIKIIGDHTDKYSQAYFAYDSKKTGGLTISHLRFGNKPIKSTYYVNHADFVACHVPAYVNQYDIVQDVKPGGTFLLNCRWTVDELDENLPAKMKKYIAENNIKFYIINAIDKAREIGMGKRTNTILQAAFFSLAGILPMETAVEYMKAAALKSYGKKGMQIVELNYKAIDAGANELVRVDVPEAWKNAVDAGTASCEECSACSSCDSCGGMYEHFKTNILEPINRQKGDDIPVSAFKDYADGVFPQGLAATEKRGVAVDVPEWDPAKCIQCTQCSLVCPHAAIRPFILNEEEVKNAPAGFRYTKMMGKGYEDKYYAICVDPLDCMGCGVCVNTCPANLKSSTLVMKSLESQIDKQACFDYAVSSISEKETAFAVDTIKGSQFKQPLLEFSGACAGCVETTYAKLVTQLFGDRMYIANATGCSSIWGGSAPSTPYTVNKAGKGPAWANSLFEDNAEFGLGMALAVNQRRAKLKEIVASLATKNIPDDIKAALSEWLEKGDDKKLTSAVSEKAEEAVRSIADCVGCGCDCDSDIDYILKNADMFTKKSMWIFGGDGWAYDIGFGGLDHVLASGNDINIFVFDTEVYSNTGGQASKASQIGQVAQFAAAGKAIGKKDLASIAMSYGYIYVAQVGLGANPAQTIKAVAEAESYDGPSLIIGYSPCEMHGVKGGMTNSQSEIKRAVAAGYWHLFRFDPRKKLEGKNPFILDSKEPSESYEDFINNENRYKMLVNTYPERAKQLFEVAVEAAKIKYAKYAKLAKED